MLQLYPFQAIGREINTVEQFIQGVFVLILDLQFRNQKLEKPVQLLPFDIIKWHNAGELGIDLYKLLRLDLEIDFIVIL